MRRTWWGLLGMAAALLVAGGALGAAGLENPALLEDRAPIRIDSDADFTEANGVRAGNGTAENPFLIAHWRIQAPDQHVRIANTTRAFVVRNLELTGQCAPLGNGTNCLLEAGVVLLNVRGGAVLRSSFADLDRSALHIADSRDVEVVENRFTGGAAATQGTGLLVHKSSGVQVRGNHFQGQGPPTGSLATAAIRIWDSNETLVQGNEVRGAREFGLNLLSARGTLVEDNTFAGNRFGILAQGRDAVVRYNTITDNTLYGIQLHLGWLHLERNDITFNHRGLDVANGVANATLRANNIMGSGEYGLRLFNTATVDARENYWGAGSGPNVNHTGPGSGELISLERAERAQFAFQPFLSERASGVGAFAPRPGRTIVTTGPGAGSGTGGPGQPQDPAPVAVFEGPGEAFVGHEVQFSAALSRDPEGGALRYAWDFGDNATAGGMRVTHAWAAPGEYVVRLTVTDPTGLSGTASVALAVAKVPFTVGLQVNATAGRGEALQLRAGVSGAPGAVLYRFTTEGPGTFRGEPSPANTTVVRLTEPREHLVGVEARAGNETRTAFARVLVANRPPVARISVEPAQPTTDDEVRLSAAASVDPDGDPLTFTWDFGTGGAPAAGPEVVRRLPVGLHVVRVTASDGFASASEQVAVEVKPGTGAGPGAEPRPVPGPGAVAAAGAALGIALALRRRR